MSSFILLAGLSIVANVIVSFVILRYKELRKDDYSNILLLQMNIVQILFFILAAISINSDVTCGFVEVLYAPLFCVFLLLIVITIDWYIKTYSENKHPKIHRTANYIAVTSAYGVTIAVGYSLSHYCSYKANVPRNVYTDAVMLHTVHCFSLVFLGFMILVNIVHGIQRMRRRWTTGRAPNNIGLAIANIFMLTWLTTYLPPLSVAIWTVEPRLVNALLMLAMCAYLASPIFNLIYLYRCEKFNVFLRRTFRCQCNDYQNEPVC